jgi:hypothetical protein
MNDFLSYLTLRTMFIFISTAFSLLVVMLALNILTVDEAVLILHLDGDSANAFKAIVGRIQEVTGNIMQIISQLLNKLFSWAGVDVDLSKIKVDVNAAGSSAQSLTPPVVEGGGVVHPPLTQDPVQR